MNFLGGICLSLQFTNWEACFYERKGDLEFKIMRSRALFANWLVCIEKVTCRITLLFIESVKEIETPLGLFSKLSLLDGVWGRDFLRVGWVRLAWAVL